MSSAEKIQISLSAMAEMLSFDFSHEGQETAGLLIGHEENDIVYIDQIRVGEQKGNPVHVEISMEELTNAAIEISSRNDNKVIVGWFHTHPGLTAFLSSTDVKTQSIYQSLMPNAIAIVIDGVKYQRSYNYEDLDFGVFRVINSKQTRLPFMITDSVDFGLKSFLESGKTIENTVKTIYSDESRIRMPILDKARLESLKAIINNLNPHLEVEDITAIKSWIELAEAMQDGSIKEVPVDIGTLTEKLENSLVGVERTIVDYAESLRESKASRMLFLIGLGVIIEFIGFYFLMFR